MKTTTTLAALAAILVGATCSGQISLPTHLPIGSITERAEYEAGKVQNIGVNLFSDPFFFPNDDRVWGKQLIATGLPLIAPVSDLGALAALALMREQKCMRHAWEDGRYYFQTHPEPEYVLEVVCWGPDGPSGGIILFISHTFFHLENQGGEWRFPAWITNTPPTLNLARDFYLEIPPGIQYASIRAMDNNGNVETVSTCIPSGSKVKPQGGTPGCLYVDASGFMMIPQRLLSPTARRLVLTLDYGTNGVAKFNENGQLITSPEPVWIANVTHSNGGSVKVDGHIYTWDSNDRFNLYFEPSKTVAVEHSADLKTWTEVATVDDAGYPPGQSVFSRSYPDEPMGFYRARYKE